MNIKYNILFTIKFLITAICTILLFSANASAKTINFSSEPDIKLLAFLTVSNDADYKNLSPEQKAKLRKKLKEWKSLPPEKRKRLRKKMQELEKMPPEARQLYHQRFKQWQNLPAAERNLIRKNLENWNNLSPREKENIRRRFKD